jgi:ABC-type dipeptide/oligopeptide/nickel transport system ATPase component
MTMLFVTHEMRFAREVADRVVMFDHGAVVEQAPPAELFTCPRHERTQAFLRALLRDELPPVEPRRTDGGRQQSGGSGAP